MNYDNVVSTLGEAIETKTSNGPKSISNPDKPFYVLDDKSQYKYVPTSWPMHNILFRKAFSDKKKEGVYLDSVMFRQALFKAGFTRGDASSKVGEILADRKQKTKVTEKKPYKPNLEALQNVLASMGYTVTKK